MKIVKNVKDINNLIFKSGVKIFGIGSYPSTRSEIWSFAEKYEIICSAKTGEFDSVAKKAEIFCLDYYPKGIIEKNPKNILSQNNIIRHMKEKAGKNKVAVYIYKPDIIVERICRKNNWKLIANNHSLFKKLNDKSEFSDILRRSGYRKEKLILKADEFLKNPSRIFELLGEKIVVQFLKEGGGRGTLFFSRSQKKSIGRIMGSKLKELRIKKNSKILVTRFVNGAPISIAGCITKDNGILTSNCRYQLIDIGEVNKTDSFGIFCGNDWTLANNIPENINSEAKKLIVKVGKVIKKMGARGIFGLDLIWNKEHNSIVPIELNPRLLGTVPVSAQVYLNKKLIPMEAFHILEFLGIKYKIDIKEIVAENNARLEGTHLILYNRNRYPVTCGVELKGGIYKIFNNKIKFIRAGFELSDIKNPNEFIITDGVPIKGLIYGKNRKLLRIIAKRSLSINYRRELNKWGKSIVKNIYFSLKLRKANINK